MWILEKLDFILLFRGDEKMQNPELKVCPFCSGKAKIAEDKLKTSHNIKLDAKIYPAQYIQ